MKCPQCGHEESKVIESRDVTSDESVRRRRECLKCQHRFTTYERLERPVLTVIKKDGTRQMYSRDKLVSGLQKACEKTTITNEEFARLVGRIENSIYDSADGQVTSDQIGSIVMETLADTNQVAYVRFASVYRNFTDIESFEQELARIKDRIKK